jgi:dTDP-4-dehydrorhamnose 3,5-epimerase
VKRPGMIHGVVLKNLVTHADDRGFFREVIRLEDAFFAAGFGQLSHSLVYPGIAKAWHGHERQSQWTYVACGVLRVAMHDSRPDSETYQTTQELLLGDHQAARVYLLPPGVVHGYRCLAGPAHVIYVTSGAYEPAEEIRLTHDDPAIGYDWSKSPPIR